MLDISKYDKRTLRTRRQSPRQSFTGCRFENQPDRDENLEILDQARRDWECLHTFRKRAQRAAMYADGRQFEDVMQDPDRPGKVVCEKDYLARQGKIPIVQNIIASIVRSILGQHRSSSDKSVVFIRNPAEPDQEQLLSDVLQSIATANQVPELDAQNLNYFLLSGALMQRISYSYFKEYDRSDVYIENVDYNRIFFNPDVKDVRLNDVCRIGVVHDLSLAELLQQFCKNEREELWMRNRFEAETSKNSHLNALSGDEMRHFDFASSYGNTRMRVVECWFLKTVWRTYVDDPFTASEGITSLSVKQLQDINRKRIAEVQEWNAAHPDQTLPESEVALVEYRRQMEPEWNVAYLLSDGTCLLKSQTPYAHQEHPFCLRLAPMISGNVYGIVHQIIDQQRMINRIITLWDMIVGASAKGVLLIPEDVLGDKTPEEFADEWVRFNGVLVYRPSSRNPTAIPQQITASATPAGLPEMLNIYLSMIRDVSGVHEAMQGKPAASGVSGRLYQQETVNSSVNILDLMKMLAAFKEVRDRKVLKVALQFYAGRRSVVSESSGRPVAVDAEKIKHVDFDLKVIQNTDTPSYREGVDNRLMQMVTAGMIPPDIYFKNSPDPTSKKIYEDMKKMAQQAQQGQPPQVPPDVQQQAQQGDPKAVGLLRQAVGMEQPAPNLQVAP
jgi:hypothetical protein